MWSASRVTDAAEIHRWLNSEFGISSRLRDAGLQAVSWNEGERILIWVGPGTTDDVLDIVHEQFPAASLDVVEGIVRGIAM
jgi:hypothetical protein